MCLVFIIYYSVVKANEPNLLKEFGGHLELADDWARHLLKSMEWVKRKRTTRKVEPPEKFLPEEIFSYQRDLPLDLVLNLDQTPLSYVSPGKYTFCLKLVSAIFLKFIIHLI